MISPNRYFLFIALACLPCLLAPGWIATTAGLWELAALPHPYFLPQQALLLYVLAPTVALSGIVLFLAPGLLLAPAVGCGAGAGLLAGAAFAFGICLNLPLRHAWQTAVLAGCCAAVGFWANRRKRYSLPSGRLLVEALVVEFLLLAVLTPKIYWENFTGDGAHMFETARLLFHQPLPFWGPSAGDLASWPSMNSFLWVFVNSWFVGTFGPLEASVRLSAIMPIGIIYILVVSLAEFRQPRKLTGTMRLLILAALGVYVLTLAFSASYDPYSADLADPLGLYSAELALYLGAILSFLQGRGWQTCLLALLAAWVSPGGAVLVCLWLVAAYFFLPAHRRTLPAGAWAVGLYVISSLTVPILAKWLNQPPPGTEYSVAHLIDRFWPIQVRDVYRVGFWVVPCGILPALTVVLWRRQDPLARAVSAVALAWFALFYFQGYTVLHYYIPAMVLPLIVYWRRPFGLAVTALAVLVAAIAAWPGGTTPVIAGRIVGSAVDCRLEGYETSRGDFFAHTQILQALFPPVFDPLVPNQLYGGAPVAWSYYAMHRSGSAHPIYRLQPESAPAPKGAYLAARDGGAALYLLDEASHRSLRYLHPATPSASPVFWISQHLIFRPPSASFAVRGLFGKPTAASTPVSIEVQGTQHLPPLANPNADTVRPMPADLRLALSGPF